MRYKEPEKSSIGETIWMFFWILFLIAMFAAGIWYQWLDISTKLAIRDMAKQQQEASHGN